MFSFVLETKSKVPFICGYGGYKGIAIPIIKTNYQSERLRPNDPNDFAHETILLTNEFEC